MERGYTNDIEQWHSKTVHFVSTVEDNDLREKGKKLERLLMGEEQVSKSVKSILSVSHGPVFQS